MFTIKDLKETEDKLLDALNSSHKKNYKEVCQIADMLAQMGYSDSAAILSLCSLQHKILVELSGE